MCGFAGILNPESADKEKLQESLRTIKHRGPDNTRIFAGSELLLGFNRLKIIDLSDAANQPFEDERFVLVFNGEIYNYIELKRELNLNTKTSSDTEVLFEILKKFRAEPSRGLNLLNGMFAFAFYDKQEKILILGRDRLGVKPLHYTLSGNKLIFASEAKALRPFLPQFQVNHKAVVNYLVNRTLGYGKGTFFKGVYQIPPGEFALIRPGEQVSTIRYWNPAGIKKSVQSPRDEEACAKFRELFMNAVAIRLRADVPVASFLSGGLDSSAVTAAMAAIDPQHEVTAVSAVYTGDKFDERKYAEKVVGKYRNIKPVWLEIEEKNAFDNMRAVVRQQETPLPDGSMTSQYLLLQKIHELGMKVVLTGEGGDEILGGYVGTYLPAAHADALRRLDFRNFSARAVFHALPVAVRNLLRRIITYVKFRKFFLEPGRLDLVDSYYREIPGWTVLNTYMASSLEYWTLPGFLQYDDRNSMAHSIETRSPFVDYRLVEFMLALPDEFKIRNGTSKWILRKALGDLLPPEVSGRKDKQGFYAPMDKWGKNIPDRFWEDRDFRREFGYLNIPETLTDATMKWRIFTLWLWYKEFIAA